jgi:hypothetical protein
MKRSANGFSVSDIAAEGDGLLACCQALVVADGIAGDGWAIHGCSGLVVGVIAGSGADAG